MFFRDLGFLKCRDMGQNTSFFFSTGIEVVLFGPHSRDNIPSIYWVGVGVFVEIFWAHIFLTNGRDFKIHAQEIRTSILMK